MLPETKAATVPKPSTGRTYEVLAEATEVVKECERLMEEQGYVRLMDVAESFCISRMTLFNTLDRAVRDGCTTQDRVKTFRESYQHLTREAKFRITHDNLRWLKEQAEQQSCSVHDILNRALISLQTSTPSSHDNTEMEG